MSTPKAISWLPIAAILAALAVLPACSVNVKDPGDDGNSKVDINTPVGAIHVNENADARDAGLPVYPGARMKPKSKDGDSKSANVNLSAFGYGLKVVALEYESDDAPGKIIAFYHDQLKKYGNVVECPTLGHFHLNMKYSDKSGDSHSLTCDSVGGTNIELKAGTDENQHIVAVESEGKGSSFSLVYVRTHGKEADI